MTALLFADVAIAVLVIEAIVLLTLFRKHGLLSPSRILAMCGAGLALLAALHAQAAGAPLPIVVSALACAGACHALDLVQRLRDRAASRPTAL